MESATLEQALELARARRRLPPPEARRLLRERAGLSQDDVARALGVTRAAVALWEQGSRTPRPVHLVPYLALLERLAAEGLQR
jgi:transcriptional regulator with XRE-family HTH domain